MATRFQHGQQVLIICMPFLGITYEKMRVCCSVENVNVCMNILTFKWGGILFCSPEIQKSEKQIIFHHLVWNRKILCMQNQRRKSKRFALQDWTAVQFEMGAASSSRRKKYFQIPADHKSYILPFGFLDRVSTVKTSRYCWHKIKKQNQNPKKNPKPQRTTNPKQIKNPQHNKKTKKTT